MAESPHRIGPPIDLAQHESELRAAQRLGRVGSWVWYPASEGSYWSEEMYRIFGIDPGAPPLAFAALPAHISPDTWPLLAAAVDRALHEGEPYCVELAYRHVDGGPGGWIECRGEAIRDATASIVGLRGTVQEVSDRRSALQAVIDAQVQAQISRDRTAMLRTFSENIRTSLNAVVGCAHLLKARIPAGEPQERWVEHILAGSGQIVRLLGEMERLDSGLLAQAVSAGTSTDPAGATDERLKDLLDLIPCPVLIHDRSGAILYVSKALTESTGYTADELPTRAAWAARAYTPQDARDVSDRIAAGFAALGVTDAGERWITTKTGEKRLWRLFGTVAGPAAGDRALFVSLGVDVSPATQPPGQ